MGSFTALSAPALRALDLWCVGCYHTGQHSMPEDASVVGPVTLLHGNDTQYFVLHAAWADIC